MSCEVKGGSCTPRLLMATAGSEVATSRRRTASQSNYRRSICSSEYISLEEVFHPRDTFSSSPPAYRPSDDIVSWRCGKLDCLLDCEACRDLLEESDLPLHDLQLPCKKPSSRPNSSEMANEAVGVNDEPISDPTHSRSHAKLLPSTKPARCFGCVNSIPPKIRHLWLGSLLGLGSLTLAIVSLLMFTVRSYRTAVWTTRNDELQACTGLIQVRDSHLSACC